MTLGDFEAALRGTGLRNLGAFHPAKDDASKAATLILLGPDAGFWDILTASPEYKDGGADPVDRWSARVIKRLAKTLDASAHFPFGGSPYMPFLDWAKQSGRAWNSEVGMLIHADAGLMVSYRGALGFKDQLALPTVNATRPCDTCAAKPCVTACPVDALTPDGYDIPVCKSYLASDAGADCMQKGCSVRRICPISVGARRGEAQSAYHMRMFRGA